MQSTAVERRKPALLVAAESIAIASGMTLTVADVLRARALEHYTESLRQYLAIRLGSQGAAQQALEELGRRVEGMSAEALSAAPGPRAQLFKLARQVGGELKARLSKAGADLLWLAPADDAPHSYVTRLARVRRELDSQDAELLELRYARELSPEELSFVVGRATEDVITALERAASRAAGIVGQTPPSRFGGLRGALLEAFALVPSHGSSASTSERKRVLLAPGTVIGDRYAIQKRVGEGSFGDVYRARDTDVPGHVVALKILHRPAMGEEARKSALRELRLIASVFHPSVVDFKDHGWHRDRLWFVMPWYEGETLEERIRRGPLSRAEAREIFVPLAQALATMHATGIRHQDVKPDNIFLARIGEAGGADQRILPVLIDLGVAAKEAEMIVAGTPLYFAPEVAAQYASKSELPKVTTKADVFSLALSLRNALEPSSQEQVPGTAVEAFIAHRADNPPGPPVDKALKFLEPAFRRWLAKDASERPTARELAKELELLTRPERERERRRAVMGWALPIAMGAIAAVGSITYVYLRERDAATAARLRADETQSRLGIVSQRSEALRESYEHSELTRQQLSQRLASREREAKKLSAQLIDSRREADALSARMRALSQHLDDAKKELEAKERKVESQLGRIALLEGDLFSSQQRRALTESELRESRSRLSAAEQELDGLRVRARTLLAELDRARSDANVHKDRVESLEDALGAAVRERSRVVRDLASERARSAELSQRVRTLSSPSGSAASDDSAGVY